MKTIGLIGGMSWESSIEYYRIINQLTRDRLGGVNSASLILVSLNFAEIETLQKEGNWDQAAAILAQSARHLEEAGADLVLICTNTMHMVADRVQAAVSIPLLHIADAAGRVITKAGIQQVGLLGTRFTMEKDFYRGRLQERYGIKVLIPGQDGRAVIHRVIYDELVQGKILPASRGVYLELISDLIAEGAEAVLLACTEIGLLVKQDDVPIPVFDTMEIHARGAVEFALGDDPGPADQAAL